MRLRRTGAVVAPLLALGLVVSGCGGGGGGNSGNGVSSDKVNPESLKAIDISKTPYDQVKDGGTIRWAMDQFSTQWNYNQLNGPESSTFDVINALMPEVFLSDAQGEVRANPAYLTSAKLTSKSPETLTFEINPKATWSDGTPISYKDFVAQWQALNGKNSKFQIATSTGYSSIASVKKGKDDKEVIITFAEPFSEWKALFSPLYPAKYQSTPDVFNNGYKNKIPVTAGPFKLESLDKASQTVTVVRDPDWWGRKPKLDKIVYKAMKVDASIGAFANGELDYIDIGPDASGLKRAQGAPGAVIHKAAGPDFRHITINGQSKLISDVNVRQAIAMAMNRNAITKSDLKGLGWPVATMGNHFFVNTQTGYQDNSGAVGKYNPEQAKKLLEQAGWKLDGQFRKKDGQTLELKFVIPAGIQLSKDEAKLVQSMEAQVGVKIDIVSAPSNEFFDKWIFPGKFDLTVFSWLGTPFPISSSKSIYQEPTGDNIHQNFARVGSDKIDSLMNEAIGDLDPADARKKLNEADKLIWQEVHSLILYQRPQITATSKGVVNMGSYGLQQFADYTAIGFKK